MHTVHSRAHRPTIVAAVLALVFSLAFIAAPAQAETGSTPPVTASDSTGSDPAADVPDDAAAAAVLPEVTPAAVTFPDPCTVIVPETAGVIYSVTLDRDTQVIDAGPYDGTEFDGDSAAVFTAAADDSHVIADGATTSWSYTPADECFDGGGNAELVTTTTSCSAVTFTNISDVTVNVAYGSFENQNEDGDFTLAPGASKKVKTSRSSLDFAAFGNEDEGDFQADSVDVPQDCGSHVDDPKPTKSWPIKHPTAAPDAGVTGNSNGPATPFLFLLGVATLIAVRRAYSSPR